MTKVILSLAASLMLASSALAQPSQASQPSQPSPDYPANAGPTPGVPGPEAVNPAPDAEGRPYLGVGRGAFYDPMVREKALEQRLTAAAASGALSRRQVLEVKSALAKVVSEDRTQTARHGTLRDWDRERLNDMMNHIVAQYSALQG